jgi:DNA (cytosine-5)-methyltransferase 1
MSTKRLRSLEICAGAGGQALGLEWAGFEQVAAIELDTWACATLRRNRPWWNIIEADIRNIDGRDFENIDLLAGGVPCPPFSVAGRQLGSADDRDLFPAALQLVHDTKPNAVILENVPGLAKSRFASYRVGVRRGLERMGYVVDWQPLNARDFGVAQLRPRFVLVALRPPFDEFFAWPKPRPIAATVGDTLFDLMASRGWPGAPAWVERANDIAPTLVGGSKLHGGPDLGPTRAKRAWRDMGVDALGLADAPPDESFARHGDPKLTVRMAARLQGFPDSWEIVGKKTVAYRQVGNAFPPPVAKELGKAVRNALLQRKLDRAVEDLRLDLRRKDVAASGGESDARVG